LRHQIFLSGHKKATPVYSGVASQKIKSPPDPRDGGPTIQSPPETKTVPEPFAKRSYLMINILAVFRFARNRLISVSFRKPAIGYLGGAFAWASTQISQPRTGGIHTEYPQNIGVDPDEFWAL
jgi:hypothetical protein